MSKKNIVLGLILIALIALAYLYQGPLKNWQNSFGKPNNFLAKLNIEKIDKMEISREGKSIILEKQGKGWKIYGTKDFYVKKELMDSIIKNLSQAVGLELELISNDKERKNEFGISESGIKVKLHEGGKMILEFIIGKQGSDFISSYISTPESSATYSVKANLKYVFDQTEWRDLTIFSSDKEKLSKIRFQYPNREFTVEKKDGNWVGTIPSKFSISKEKIDKILEIISNLEATNIPEQTFVGTGLEKHLIIIEASGEGIDNTIMVGTANKEGLYYAKRGDSDSIYLITKEQRDELDKWIWQMK